MAAKLVVAPDAVEDIDHAYQWYDGTVTIFAAPHTARDPARWKSRLP